LNFVDASGSSWINLFIQKYETGIKSNGYNEIVYNGYLKNLNYAEIIDTPMNNVSYTSTPADPIFGSLTSVIDKKWLDTSFIGIEYFGYFKPTAVGNYSFTVNVGTEDFCLLWLGNKAVCEYLTTNADIVKSMTEFKQTFMEDSYVPIRIQYFTSKQWVNASKVNTNERILNVIVKNNDTNLVLDNNKCFYSILDNNKNLYFPRFLYCAFTSSTMFEFKEGKFNCYSMGENLDIKQDSFFSYMKYNKKNINSGINDSVVSDGLSISEYGTLPNGINYTDAYSSSTNIPSKLSVYRIYSDIRMGRTFQVNKNKTNGTHLMNELSTDLLSLTNKYTEFPNYYASSDSINMLPETPITSQNECLEKCNNVDNSKCSHFYTYTKDDKQFCVTGTNYVSPLFNQIPLNNQSNGSLFIRGYQTSNPTIEECIAGKKGDDKYSSVKNTIDYTASNPYYNYTIDNDIITDFTKLGDCNDPNLKGALSEYDKRKKEAENILYNNEQYRSDGYYMKSPGTFSKPNYETFETQTTDATKDTGSNINKLRSIQQSVQQKENAIHQNKKQISGDLIPTFTKTRDILKDDNKYDYNGDVLMYLRDTKIPSKDEQRLIDSSDERFKQSSMYSLGIVTAATLIVLAIYLGKE
jgi:hypothetical protein